MSNFWKYAGFLILGAVAVKYAGDALKKKDSDNNNSEIEEILVLLNILESKENRTEEDTRLIAILKQRLLSLKK